jgi:hypothetical protein
LRRGIAHEFSELKTRKNSYLRIRQGVRGEVSEKERSLKPRQDKTPKKAGFYPYSFG